MTETTTGVAYDPIPDLAWLLGAAQRQTLGYDAQGGIRIYANRLVEGLSLPELATAAEVYTAIRKALTEAADGGAIREGTKVKLIDPPGSRVPCGAVGVAEESPGSGGLFWVQFPEARMHTRVSEVEIVAQEDPS